MALIYRDTRMSDVIVHEPSVIPVINRFGINLGTGDYSVAEICGNHGLDCDFVLVILNTFINDGYFPEDTLLGFRTSEIIGYLIKTYNYYRNYQMPNIRRLFSLLLKSSGESNASLDAMFKFYQELEHDIETRIGHDLNDLFPAISAMEADGSGIVIPEAESDSIIEDKLGDLKSMFIKHLSGSYDLNLCYAVIVAIITLEKDMRQNNRIRDRILLPIGRSLQHKS